MPNEKQFERFFELLKEIVNDGRPVSEKVEIVMEAAAREGAETELEEFTSWSGFEL